jgi:hypothetical protein
MSEELRRAFRVADMMVTCHSILRDRYARRALILDVLILIASVWLTAMAFVDAEIARHISFPGASPTLTIGLIAVVTFVLSLFQLRVDWKQRADRHDQAARAYVASKFELAAVTNNGTSTNQECEVTLDRYRSLGGSCIPVPENEFNRLKRRHLIKVLISMEISRHPGTSIWLIRLKHWFSDSIALYRGETGNDTF